MYYLTIQEDKIYLKDRTLNKLVKQVPQFCNDWVITPAPIVEEDLYDEIPKVD